MNKPQKFLAMGVTAMAFVIGVNALSPQQNTAQLIEPVRIEQTTQQKEFSNPHNFTSFSIVKGAASENSPVGAKHEVVYKDKVIGEIEQHATHKEVKSNLSPEDTIKIFKELKAEGKAQSISLKGQDFSEEGGKPLEYNANSFKEIITTLKKSSDLEQVLLETSTAYRSNEVAATPNKADVLKKIQETREQHFNNNNYKPLRSTLS